jgi:hypothetical protein
MFTVSFGTTGDTDKDVSAKVCLLPVDPTDGLMVVLADVPYWAVLEELVDSDTPTLASPNRVGTPSDPVTTGNDNVVEANVVLNPPPETVGVASIDEADT